MASLTVKALEAKLRELNGNMAAAGRHFGVTRSAVCHFIERHPTLRQVLTDCRESRIDVAESALDRAVLNGEGWAIGLTLKTIGKGRGYVERQEHTGKDGDPIIPPSFIEVPPNPALERNGAPH